MEVGMSNQPLVQASGVKRGNLTLLIVSWLWVGVPLAWGVLQTMKKSMALFQ
jgi:hypothetical protein